MEKRSEGLKAQNRSCSHVGFVSFSVILNQRHPQITGRQAAMRRQRMVQVVIGIAMLPPHSGPTTTITQQKIMTLMQMTPLPLFFHWHPLLCRPWGSPQMQVVLSGS